MASGDLQRVIIDTDPGVDDAQAILFALRLGAFQIDAVTTVFRELRGYDRNTQRSHVA